MALSTIRVDEIAGYDLIWKDTNILSGMVRYVYKWTQLSVYFTNSFLITHCFFFALQSFYLPGSIDVNDKTIEQWNNIPPPLYLWSRRDWSITHKTRALEQGHITQMHHSTDNEEFHHAEIHQGGGDNGIVQDMDISPTRISY